MKKTVLTLLLVLIAGMGVQAQLLYKISGNGLKAPSYVIGTYHLAPVSFTDSIHGLKAALSAAEQVYGEIDMEEMMKPDNLMKMQQAMMLPEGTTLNMLLTADEMTRFNAFLKQLLGTDMTNPMVEMQMGKLTPQALNTQLTVLMYMMKKPGFDAQNPFDGYFQKVAKEQGKPVGGLETFDLQMEVLFGSMTLERQKELLMCLVDNNDVMIAMMEKVIEGFFTQDLSKVQAAMDEKQHNSCDSTPEEDARLIYKRNADWMTKMPAIMAEKPTFFAVGAAHLTGEKGLIHLLKTAGYTVEGVQ